MTQWVILKLQPGIFHLDVSLRGNLWTWVQILKAKRSNKAIGTKVIVKHILVVKNEKYIISRVNKINSNFKVKKTKTKEHK